MEKTPVFTLWMLKETISRFKKYWYRSLMRKEWSVSKTIFIYLIFVTGKNQIHVYDISTWVLIEPFRIRLSFCGFWQSNATFLKLCFLFDLVYFVSLWKKARRVLHFGNAVRKTRQTLFQTCFAYVQKPQDQLKT